MSAAILSKDGAAAASPETERRFNDLAEKWVAETAHLSAMSSIVLHRSYQEIIGLGRDVLPLILRRLSADPNHWFWALRAIAGEDPCPLPMSASSMQCAKRGSGGAAAVA